jgi:para-nitrobenzyl esterase
MAAGLFIRAIGESGFDMPEETLSQAEQEGMKLAERVGAQTLVALRPKSAAELLLQASDRAGLHPIVDGDIVPENPFHVYARDDR